MEDANPDMVLVHCVIHRENLVAKNISPVLNDIMESVIKYIIAIKAYDKCERLFEQFCKDENTDHETFTSH